MDMNMNAQPRTLASFSRVCLVGLVAIAVGSHASDAAGQRKDESTCLSFGTVKIWPNRSLALHVSYPPRGQTPASSRAAVRVVASFDLYVPDPDDGSASDSTIVRSRFLERRSSEAILLPGEALSFNIGEEFVSGYSASHLSLIGPSMGELEERMKDAAKKFDFEAAAGLRDRVRALRARVLPAGINAA